MENLGGRVELKPFSPEHFKIVAEAALSRYPALQQAAGLKEAVEAGYLVSIIKELKSQPKELQREFLGQVCGPEGVKFPNWEDLVALFVKLNHIPWFEPPKKPNKKFLQEQVNAHLSALNLPTLPIRIISIDRPGSSLDTLPVAWPGAWPAVDAARRTASWSTAWHAAWADSLSVARGDDDRAAAWVHACAAGMGTSFCAAWAAGWIVVQDLMPWRGYKNGNPFAPLIEIYQVGLQPEGKVGGEFIINVPKIEKPNPLFRRISHLFGKRDKPQTLT